MAVENEIKENKRKFNLLENKFKKQPSVKFALELLELLMTGLFGVYSNNVLEDFFIEYGNTNKKLKKGFDLKEIKENSVLHVATKAYLEGGHTRVLERWIDVCDDLENHSVVLINQTNLKKIPQKLKDVVSEKNGKLILFNSSTSLINKSNDLRDLASGYETIILHHHPNDPVPLMAFSAQEFKRPVICFNHSGHTFWLGSSVVDHCIDIEKNQNICSIEKRGITNTTLIDMPIDFSEKETSIVDEFDVREKLNINKAGKIMLSMASMYKYTPIEGLSFVATLREILKKDQNYNFIGIGISESTADWKNLVEEYKGRVHLLGYLPHHEVSKYLIAADLYLDSFPYNSWVSLMDAIHIGNCPCLVLKTPVGHSNFLEGTYTVCSNVAEFIEKSEFLLNSELDRKTLFEELHSLLKEKCSNDFFKSQINNILKEVPVNFVKANKVMPIVDNITSFDTYNYLFRLATAEKIIGSKKGIHIQKEKKGFFKSLKFYVFGKIIFELKTNKLDKVLKKYSV